MSLMPIATLTASFRKYGPPISPTQLDCNWKFRHWKVDGSSNMICSMQQFSFSLCLLFDTIVASLQVGHRNLLELQLASKDQ